jgi:transcriptional regulator with XRE-family HTH domain
MSHEKNNSGGDAHEMTERPVWLYELFGRNLSRIRRNAGYSQLVLASEAGFSHIFINGMEHAAKGASFETLARLSSVLRAPVKNFFEQDEGTAPDSFRYPDQIDSMVDRLHEMIDTWNEERPK